MIKHLKSKFPDVCKQVIELDKVYSHADVENKVLEFSALFGQSAICYEQSRKKVTIYTSKIFTEKLASMKQGDSVTFPNTGKTGIVSSTEPFFASCTLCIRVDGDTYDCSYFM